MKYRIVYFQTFKVDESKKPDNFLEIARDECLLTVELRDDATTKIIPAKFDADIFKDIKYDEERKELSRTVSILIDIDDNLVKGVGEDDIGWWFNSRLTGHNLSEDWCEFWEKTFEVNFNGITDSITAHHTTRTFKQPKADIRR